MNPFQIAISAHSLGRWDRRISDGSSRHEHDATELSVRHEWESLSNTGRPGVGAVSCHLPPIWERSVQLSVGPADVLEHKKDATTTDRSNALECSRAGWAVAVLLLVWPAAIAAEPA